LNIPNNTPKGQRYLHHRRSKNIEPIKMIPSGINAETVTSFDQRLNKLKYGQ